ncbi:MAG: cation transporter [Lentisphaerae bacterium]|nr:cation transporter [Lentisphaerota bacterium]
MLTGMILKIAGINTGSALSPSCRLRCGTAAGITGIVCNLLLMVIKVVLAVISGSISVAADAVNNLSDAGSGIIAVTGFRLSAAPPDAEHPFGHGRSEYVAALVTALLISGLGITFFKDSAVAIFRPGRITADTVTVVILAGTVGVKCWLFFFHRKVGKLINSDVLKAAAFDSLSDCLGTSVAVAAMICSRYTDFPVDGCAGLAVAAMILYAGFSVLKETVSKLLGEPPEKNMVEKLKNTILSCPGIDGVHDIMIHNYGENSYYVTAHAEISCDGDRFSAHDILENAEVAVGRTMPVHLLLHGDPYSKDDPEVIFWRSRMENETAGFDSELKLYDFKLVKEPDGKVTALAFHLLVPHRYAMSEAEILAALTGRMKKYCSDITLDIRFLKSFI